MQHASEIAQEDIVAFKYMKKYMQTEVFVSVKL